MTPWSANSFDMPEMRGVDRGIQLLKVAARKEPEPGELAVAGAFVLSTTIVDLFCALIDAFGGFKGFFQQVVAAQEDPKRAEEVALVIKDALLNKMGNHYWSPHVDSCPLTFLPGKSTNENILVVRMTDGKAIEMKHNGGEY